MKTKIAINGFGRIGRVFFRHAFEYPGVEIVAINDLMPPEIMAYLLEYDTVYGRYEKSIGIKDGELVVDGRKIKILQEKEPSKLPWKELDVDIVIESTGVFVSSEKAMAHLTAGAKRVVIAAPAQDGMTPTFTPNVGEDILKREKITSNGSCTTNATIPITVVMGQNPGIKKAALSTVHAYTASQILVDGVGKSNDFGRARAGAQNIIPSTTSAILGIAETFPELKNKFDGVSFRVPVVCGSIIDFTFLAVRPTSVEEINSIFKKAAAEKQWEGILTVTETPLVSSDIIKNSHGSIVDLSMTKVIDGDLVKILSWYDNEWGYASMLLKHVLAVSKLI
ncbi:MAG: glyceraldehyde 3-phosphate dehydrogenase NAD-binding domain-containing protein [Candidatus Azambacteria bacterium]|nr:glyceraldehyde 3-phosphate dehydrogenase NAD-binding domain-containing protein [Candidatus Azambacteria bacterium]